MHFEFCLILIPKTYSVNASFLESQIQYTVYRERFCAIYMRNMVLLFMSFRESSLHMCTKECWGPAVVMREIQLNISVSYCMRHKQVILI